jgi:hypothetical protein
MVSLLTTPETLTVGVESVPMELAGEAKVIEFGTGGALPRT